MARMVESTTILFVPESLILNVYQVKYVLRRRGAGGEIFFFILLLNYDLFCFFFWYVCLFVCFFFFFVFLTFFSDLSGMDRWIMLVP